MPQYQGVDVDNPQITGAISNMLLKGEDKEKIMRVVGMPREVIDRVERDLKRRKEL